MEPTADDVKPKGLLNTILTTLPVVLTVLATAFAGLSSSEMTQAMYHRSVAAQQQAKAASQWAFFQFKRVRGTTIEMTAETLQGATHPPLFDPAELDRILDQLLATLDKEKGVDSKAAIASVDRIMKARAKLNELLATENGKMGLRHLVEATTPASESLGLANKDVQGAIDEAVKLIRQRKTEQETADQIRALRPADIDEATQLAEENADKFDKACVPIAETIKQLRSILAELESAIMPLRKRSDLSAQPTAIVAHFDEMKNALRNAILEYDARRYQREAMFNLKAAEIYEVRVRRSGIESDRHRDRSKNFFYCMLLAQAGVTVASLALAHRERKSLWIFAAAAGLIALGFSSYIYLAM